MLRRLWRHAKELREMSGGRIQPTKSAADNDFLTNIVRSSMEQGGIDNLDQTLQCPDLLDA
jgi:hypothetical protein